jgi:ferredoxin
MGDHHHDEPDDLLRLYRREMLITSTRLALGGVLGGLLGTVGCRAPTYRREEPEGVPTGYIIDPAKCTHNFDCGRVCPCEAVGFSGESKGADEPACRSCWINLDKCCGCGRCYRVCPDDAIVPCYGPDKIPAREIGRAPKEG